MASPHRRAYQIGERERPLQRDRDLAAHWRNEHSACLPWQEHLGREAVEEEVAAAILATAAAAAAAVAAVEERAVDV